MDGTSESQWRANLRAMQLRMKERLRIASSPRTFLLRRLRRSGRLYANKALASVAAGGGSKPLNALLSSVLARQLNLVTISASSSSYPVTKFSASISDSRRHGSSPSIQSHSASSKVMDQNTGDIYTSVFRENSRVVRVLQSVALPLIGNVCHAFMHSFNRTEVYCGEKLVNSILNRPEGQALITVSNHVAAVDDPLVLAAILPPSVLLDANRLRWTLCATDRCFTNPATSAFFRCVKVLPLARGAGVHQKGVDMAVEKLRQGDWIHIFPEGSRSRDGGKTIQNAKRGIGRLVLEAGEVPLVVPFVHFGMQEIMSIGRKLPSVRKRVVVLVGDPIKLDDILSKYQDGGVSETVIYEAIASRVGHHLRKLKSELDDLVLCNSPNADTQRISNSEESRTKLTQNEPRFQMVFNFKDSNVKLVSYYKHDDDQLNMGDMKEEIACSIEEDLYSENGLPFQEGIISRLKRFKDPAAFVSFAAQGFLSYSNGRETCSC